MIMTTPNMINPTRRLYLDDAYIKEFKGKIQFVQRTNGQYRVVLDQTAFYPLGGGQPSDTGTIKSEMGEAAVREVRIENALVVHVVDQIKGNFKEGDEITGTLDWNRRSALMRNHTLAHLMAEAIRKATHLSIEVVSSGLDVDKARLDLAHEGSLNPFVPEIENIANQIISENRPVEIKTMPRDEAEEYVTRSHENLKTLPPHVRMVRVVEIKNWHACACGGTHVKSTGEIAAAEILRRMSKGKGIERIEFKAKTS